MTIAVRATRIGYVNGTSISILLPAGTIAGDVCYVFAGHGYNITNVVSGSTNWNTLDNSSGPNFNGAIYGKKTDVSDINAGSVTVSFAGSYLGAVALITFVGSSASPRSSIVSRSSTGVTSRTLTTDATPVSGDYAIYFGSGRFNGTVTSGSGAALETTSNSEASAVLTGGLLGASGSFSDVFSFTSAPNGDYDAILVLRETPPPTTVFDSIAKTNTTLSNWSQTATSSGAGGARSSRFVQGKTYFEATPITLTGTPSVGICASNWNTSTALQSAANSLAYLASGAVQVNGVTLATIATWAQGNRIDCALDPQNFLVWFRVSGGNWNNNATNDPATGVGGIDYSSVFTQLGTLAAAVYASVTGNAWTVAFSNASFAGTPPSGYSSLDAVLYTLARNVGLAYEANPVSPQYLGPAARAIPSPLDRYQRAFSPAGSITAVSGLVEEAGVPVQGRVVEVYDRNTGELLGRTLSAVDGTWSIYALGRPTVRVVGSDPTTYNSMVFDNVVPK